MAQSNTDIIYVGTYSLRGSEGIYVFRFDRKTGTMQPLQAVQNDKSPSFLALHPSGRFLYSVNEGAEKHGGVSAYAVDQATGKLTYLNSQPSLGGGPCHISLHPTGQLAFVSNYGGGNLTVLPIESDGKLAPPSDTAQHTGSGPNTKRQDKAHAHSATPAPGGRAVYVADLGTDKLHTYEIDAKSRKVNPGQPAYVSLTPGAGPRHVAIHPNGKFLYVVEELTSSVSVFSRDAKTGALTTVQKGVKTLPADFTGQNTSADIHIDPSGKFLYQSNRGHNALAIFSIGADGKLTKVGDQPTMGKTPRNFMIHPSGEFVLVAHQDSDNITIFRRNQQTGLLTYTGQSVSVPAPVCLITK